MMRLQTDERTEAVENASYRYGYIFLGMSLLLITAYRSLVYGQAAWDLLAVVVASGAVVSLYQVRAGIIDSRRLLYGVLIAAIAAVVAAAVALLR